jgi:hypothetical protein
MDEMFLDDIHINFPHIIVFNFFIDITDAYLNTPLQVTQKNDENLSPSHKKQQGLIE